MSRVQGVKSVPSAAAAAGPLLPRSVLLLYRHILSAHRKLPPQHRELGNAYVQAEFRRHRGAAPEFLVPFERQWRDYLREVRPRGPLHCSPVASTSAAADGRGFRDTGDRFCRDAGAGAQPH